MRHTDRMRRIAESSSAETPETPSFVTIDGENRHALLLCDHASNRIPPELGDLGLSPRCRRDHIAWDIGAAGVAMELRRLLGCPGLFGGYSRLVVDLNRHPDSPELMLLESDGRTVPGNLRVSESERRRRLDRYHAPYHDAIAAHLDALGRRGIVPALISIHSYTPELWGLPRPWLLGLLWQRRDPHIDALLAWFHARGIEIGDNQPYDGHFAMGHTLERHGMARGLPHLLVELRQDQVYTRQLQGLWARRLALALRDVGLVEPLPEPRPERPTGE